MLHAPLNSFWCFINEDTWFKIWPGVSARKLTKNPVAPPPPYSCTLPITGPSTTLLLLLVLDDVECHAVVEEKMSKCLMDFSVIACLQVVQPLLTEAQGLPFVAAAGLHGALLLGPASAAAGRSSTGMSPLFTPCTRCSFCSSSVSCRHWRG